MVHFISAFNRSVGKGGNSMDCEVQDVKKNMRYKILSINGEHYLLDIRPSFWKNLFPFIFWLLPFRVFRIEDMVVLEKLKSKKIKQKSSMNTVLFAGGAGVLISNLFLDPLVDYLASKPLSF